MGGDKRDRESRGKKKKSGFFSNFLLIICIAVFLFSLYQIAMILLEYKKGNDEYRDLTSYIKAEQTAAEEEETEEIDPMLLTEIDFDGLRAVNQDVIGWIQFETIDINYPIVRGKDNVYYLTHTFKGEINSNGSIFMEALNNSRFTDDNTILYGHNMKSGAMFGLLNKYKNIEYYQENPTFYIYTPEAAYRYTIFSCYVAHQDSDTYTIGFGSDLTFDEYIKYIISRSVYDTGVDVNSSDSIITLSTCTTGNSENRFVVHGKRVDEYRWTDR